MAFIYKILSKMRSPLQGHSAGSTKLHLANVLNRTAMSNPNNERHINKGRIFNSLL